MPLEDGSYIPINSCFRVRDVPSCNIGDSVSWGPHNVLQVSTRWTVQLYLTQLQTPLQKIIVRRHPLVYQEERFSYKPVMGSKWSTTLVPEVRYPAEARLCVQTSCALVVYRVARRWNYAVDVSKGIGLCLTAREMKEFERKKASMPAESAYADDDLDNPSSSTPNAPEVKAGRGNTNTTKRTTRKKKGPVAEEEDGEDTDVEDNSNGEEEADDDDDYDDDDGDDDSGGGRRRRVATGVDRVRPTRKRARRTKEPEQLVSGETVMGFEWASADLLVVLTSEGLTAVSFFDDFSDNAEPQCRLSSTPQYLFAADPLYKGGATFSGLSRIQCTPAGADFFVVFGPFVQRVFEIREACVTFVGHVFTPQIHCVPSCACFAACPPTVKGEKASEEEEEGSGATEPRDSSMMSVASVLATPLELVTGRFTLAAPGAGTGSGGSHKSNCSRSGSSARGRGRGGIGGTEREEAKSFVLHETWSAQDVFQLSAEVGDIFLRGLFPLHLQNLDMSFPSALATTAASAEGTSGKVEMGADEVRRKSDHTIRRKASQPPLMAIGLSNHGVYAYIEGGTRVPLFVCPLMMNYFALPENRVPGMGGFALHASLSLGLCFLVNSQTSVQIARLAPALLLPVSPFSNKDPLSQVMELSDVIPHSSDARQVARQLWNRQASPSCFVWEHLLERNARSTLLFRYHAGLDAYWRAPNKEPRPSDDEGAEKGEEKAGEYLCPLRLVSNLANTDVRYSFRRHYLELRDLHGVELFIRWPCPRTSHEHEQLQQHADATVLRTKWWYLLQMTLRRCPYDHFIRNELLLANAVIVLSKVSHYMTLKLENGETLWTPNGGSNNTTSSSGISGASADTAYCAEGALGFVQAYMNEIVELTKEKKESASQLPWLYSSKWHTTLSSFLFVVTTSKEHALQVDTTTATSPFRFPCSVCAAANVAHVTTSLSSTTEHRTPAGQTETHTTTFSGRTFAPIDIFAQDFVVTRCSLCGLCDYASGPLCCICGGLLS